VIPQLNEDIRKLWGRTTVRIWPGTYRLVSLPPDASEFAFSLISKSEGGFAAVVRERDEISVTVEDSIWRSLEASAPPAQVSGPLAAMTFDLDVELSVCGYLAPAAERLAEAGISIVPQCAFRKDHLLVPAEKARQAAGLLEALARECATTA
jgi:uncharacterized protein